MPLLCTAYAAYSIAARPPSPFTSPDTAAYVNNAPLVPVGYPLFLDLVGLQGAAIVQPLLFAASLALLGTELLALTSNVVATIVVLAAIVLTPEMRAFHVSILSESLFVSGLVAFLAALSRFVRHPSWRAALVAASIAALTATIRRTAVAFVPIVGLMIVLRWRQLPDRRPVIAAAITPLIVIGVADVITARALHGEQLTSLIGRHLFAKAALIEAPAVAAAVADPVQALLARELDESYRPTRRLLAAAPGEIRASLILYYETCLQGPCVSALRESLNLPDAEIDAHFAAAGMTRIRRAPGNFAALALTHYVSLWTAFKLQHPDSAARLTEFLGAHRPLPFERETFKVLPEEQIAFDRWPPARWVQPLLLGIGLFTAAVAAFGIVMALRGTASPTLIVATLASLTAHTSLLFSAVAAAGISRFMLGIFPAVVTGGALGLWWLGQLVWTTNASRYD